MLLYNMRKLLPSPEHDASVLAEDAAGEPVELHCNETEPTAAYVFKTVADSFVGKLSYLRVISGKVGAGCALVNARTGDTEKIAKPLTVCGKKQAETESISAGDIGAVAKLVSARTGDTLCDAARVVKLPAPAFPLPSLWMAVTVSKKGDEGKILQRTGPPDGGGPHPQLPEQRRDPSAADRRPGRAASGRGQGQAEEQVWRGVIRPGGTPHRLP